MVQRAKIMMIQGLRKLAIELTMMWMRGWIYKVMAPTVQIVKTLFGACYHVIQYHVSFWCFPSCHTISCLCYHHYNSLLLAYYWFTADDQLEDGTKESLDDVKEEEGHTSPSDGGNGSTVETTEGGGVGQETSPEVDGELPEETTSEQTVAVKDYASTVSEENLPAVDEEKNSQNLSGTVHC